MVDTAVDIVEGLVDVLVEPCDPEIENCAQVFIDEVVHSETLEWLIILYLGQVLIIPVITIINTILTFNIFKVFWWWPIFQLHLLAYLPTIGVGYLYLVYGADQANQALYTELLDEATIWFIALYTANFGLFTHSLTALTFAWGWITNPGDVAQIIKFWGYTALAFYTEWFSVTRGVEIIRTMKPDW